MKSKNTIYIFLIALLWAGPCQSFINIESLRQGLKTGLYGSSGTEFSGASGNTDVFDLGINTRNIYKSQQREYILIASYEYGEALNIKNSHKGHGHFRYAQGFTPSWKWECLYIQKGDLRQLNCGNKNYRDLHLIF